MASSLLMVSLVGSSTVGPPLFSFRAEPARDWERVLENRKGWIGSDCAYSIDLGGDRILWLFDDTFYGEIEQGRRKGATMAGIHNTVAIMTGREPGRARVRFFFGRGTGDGPGSFFTPPDGVGWFWFGHGVVVTNSLYLFLWQMVSKSQPGTPEVFHFALKRCWLAVVENPGADPDAWQPLYKPVPFEQQDQIFWGSSLLQVGDWIYIYSLMSGERRRGVVVARVPARKISQFSDWRFFGSRSWTNSPKDASLFIENCQPEFSVCYLADRKTYAFVHSPADLRPVVLLQTSPSPVGPWSEPVTVYRCPEPQRNFRVFCYAAKAHPLISRPGELIISYATNSFRFSDLLDDASLYFPRFIRVRVSQ